MITIQASMKNTRRIVPKPLIQSQLSRLVVQPRTQMMRYFVSHGSNKQLQKQKPAHNHRLEQKERIDYPQTQSQAKLPESEACFFYILF